MASEFKMLRENVLKILYQAKLSLRIKDEVSAFLKRYEQK